MNKINNRVETDLIPHILLTNYKAIKDMEIIKDGYRTKTINYRRRNKKDTNFNSY